ncbi:RtcB family protein [Neomegalonema perideroedes]|uniref:RtcB family protein n=1 Tax=Neomegalonema perideroedes TaxID=217219 RepID=UPI0003A98BB3|nr:RtcB family protein [Neomegalonema perideroedes]
MSGQDLIDAGARPGAWFKAALAAGDAALARGADFAEALATALSFAPPLAPPATPLRASGELPFHVNLYPDSLEEEQNAAAVKRTMAALMRTPMVRAGAVMPDACPAGVEGAIPVGGVVLSEAIHPGMHSADVCCSVMISIFREVDPAPLLAAMQAVTHFGPGGRAPRDQLQPGWGLLSRFAENPFLKDLGSAAVAHFGTQGDGNHFAYVGRLKSSGETALVTHHGSRAPGARLYARGVEAAERHRLRLSPETLPVNAWIPPDTEEGEAYWEALQILRVWTKANHEILHDLAAERAGATRIGRFWNEHNFVFRRPDGLFAHAKGATPAFDGWAEDATELTLIPLNMAQPILIARGLNAPNGLGFSPHGAGRNFSRTAHKRKMEGREPEEVFAEETRGIEARFFSGRVDLSELPSAYKDAVSLRRHIDAYGLAEIVDEVLPYGCIMAGDPGEPLWRRKKAAA